jgi:hypothetical protein
MKEGSRVNTGLAEEARDIVVSEPVVDRARRRQLAAAIRTIKCVFRYLAVVICVTLTPIPGGI